MAGLIARQSNSFVDACRTELGITDERKIAEARYGSYHLISAAIKLPIMYIPSIMLGIFPEVLISSIVFSGLRFCAGGVHAKTHAGCTFIGNFIIGYLPTVVATLFTGANIKSSLAVNIMTIIATLSIAILVSYAPSDLKNKPIYSNVRRENLKISALILAVSLSIICKLCLNSYYSVIVITAILMEALSITPLAYKLFKNQYGAGAGIVGEGGDEYEDSTKG